MKFKIGSIVTTAKPESSDNVTLGLFGEVIAYTKSSPYPYRILVESTGQQFLYTEEELDFAVEAKENIMKFKVGDKVTVVGSDCNGAFGVIAVVEDERYGPYPYSVLMEDITISKSINSDVYAVFCDAELDFAVEPVYKFDFVTCMFRE